MKVRATILAILFSIAAAHAQNLTDWTIGPFTRPVTGNPIIAPDPHAQFDDPILHAPAQWEALHTFNPAAIVRDFKVYVLYRAEDNSGAMQIGMHTSRLGLAESVDGVHFTRRAEPVFYPAEDDQKAREWPGGVEDPRIVELEEGTYVLTYTQWNRQTHSVGIATSSDLEHWTKHGPAFLTAAGGKYAGLRYKSAGIVTRLDEQKGRLIAAKIDGKYWMYWGEGSIRLATSDDAIHWTPVEGPDSQPLEILKPRPGRFDSSFPETGPPPMLTDKCIVVLYNGKTRPRAAIRRWARMLTLPAKPSSMPKIRGASSRRPAQPVLKPELPYEKTGQYAAGTTFAEGLVFFHGKWFLYYGCADTLVSVATAPGPQPPTGVSRGFYLHPEDRVVFYGDSITEQNFYNQFVELYTVTRFPLMRVHFYGEGIGGDSVRGGWAGPIDQRLERDVFPERPTVITIMLGMNDGGYQPTTPQIDAAYKTGYEHILDSIQMHAPQARITLLGPSPYDDVTAAPWFPGGYNGVMQHFADVDRQLAEEHHATFVNLNPGTVAAIEKAKALDPRIARLLLPDHVHPEPLAHWVMAESLLKGWNAPAIVASVTLDAKAARVIASENTAVDQVQSAGGGLTWTQLDNGLPLPLIGDNATMAVVLAISDIQKALNQQPLIVTGLAPGMYSLRIDDREIATFSAEQLAAGINLADLNTPMRNQAQGVSWDVRDLVEAHYVHTRMRINNADTGAEAEGADRLQAFEDSMEDKIYARAAPVPHRFEIRPEPAAATPAGNP